MHCVGHHASVQSDSPPARPYLAGGTSALANQALTHLSTLASLEPKYHYHQSICQSLERKLSAKLAEQVIWGHLFKDVQPEEKITIFTNNKIFTIRIIHESIHKKF